MELSNGVNGWLIKHFTDGFLAIHGLECSDEVSCCGFFWMVSYDVFSVPAWMCTTGVIHHGSRSAWLRSHPSWSSPIKL